MSYIYCTECGAKAPLLHEHGTLTSYSCSECPTILTYDGNEAVYHLGNGCWGCEEDDIEARLAVPVDVLRALLNLKRSDPNALS